MKTLTLRLTDLEAEALERLAYINGKSKNKYLTTLIADGLAEYEPGTVDGEIVFITERPRFAIEVYNRYLDDIRNQEKRVNEKDLLKLVRAVDYSIEAFEPGIDQVNGVMLEELENIKKEVVITLSNKITNLQI